MSKSPQLENGYTRLANELMEALAAHRIPGEQMQVLLVIIRETYGYQRKSADISYKQFIIRTGLKKQNISRALTKLKESAIIKVIKKDYLKFKTYCINKNYDQWKRSSKKITVIKKDYKRSSKKITLPIKEIKKEYIVEYERIINYLNKKAGKNFKASSKNTQNLINARLNEGYTPEDFETVINNKAEWVNDNKMSKFFRPLTLFGTKFESYLNEKPKYQAAAVDSKVDRNQLLFQARDILKAKGRGAFLKFAENNKFSDNEKNSILDNEGNGANNDNI